MSKLRKCRKFSDGVESGANEFSPDRSVAQFASFNLDPVRWRICVHKCLTAEIAAADGEIADARLRRRFR
jgi:hypothetical protein